MLLCARKGSMFVFLGRGTICCNLIWLVGVIALELLCDQTHIPHIVDILSTRESCLMEQLTVSSIVEHVELVNCARSVVDTVMPSRLQHACWLCVNVVSMSIRSDFLSQGVMST